MNDFSQEIENFKRYGTYAYNFDNAGNLIFNVSSSKFNQVYLSIPIQNIVYDENKIKTIYNVEFEEFIPNKSIINSTDIQEDIKTQLDNVIAENEELKTRINEIILNDDNNSNEADKLATKQVILELRKASGQGRVDSDFSDTFPYTPIRKTNT